MTYWWVNSQDRVPYAAAQETESKNLHIWHVLNVDIYCSPAARVTFNGLVIRGKDTLASACCGRGWHGEDYAATNGVIRNSDIQGMITAVNISRGGWGLRRSRMPTYITRYPCRYPVNVACRA
jgi:hypothetical protein